MTKFRKVGFQPQTFGKCGSHIGKYAKQTFSPLMRFYMQAAIFHTNHILPRQNCIVLHINDVIFKMVYLFSIYDLYEKMATCILNDVIGEKVYNKYCQASSQSETTCIFSLAAIVPFCILFNMATTLWERSIASLKPH